MRGAVSAAATPYCTASSQRNFARAPKGPNHLKIAHVADERTFHRDCIRTSPGHGVHRASKGGRPNVSEHVVLSFSRRRPHRTVRWADDSERGQESPFFRAKSEWVIPPAGYGRVSLTGYTHPNSWGVSDRGKTGTPWPHDRGRTQIIHGVSSLSSPTWHVWCAPSVRCSARQTSGVVFRRGEAVVSRKQPALQTRSANVATCRTTYKRRRKGRVGGIYLDFSGDKQKREPSLSRESWSFSRATCDNLDHVRHRFIVSGDVVSRTMRGQPLPAAVS